jgi:hypothetical protein
VTNRVAEFTVLRQTIATRGTARVLLSAGSVALWATLATVQGLFSDLPLLALFPLCALGAGYEAVWALHVAAERIGRFIQVFHETEPGQASWETTAMRLGPGLPGGGVNPLFSVVFGAAALVNLGAAFAAEPTPLEVVLLCACHAAFLLRLAQTRVLAGRQRQADLAAFATARSGRVVGEPVRETSSETEKS